MNPVGTHPSREELAAFAHGKLAPEARAEVERHVAGCDACCRALRGVPDDTLVERLRDAATAPGGPPAEPDVPPELRDHPRYRVVKRLGSGGMGTVYRAEHRLMERTVALKVISREFTRNPQAVERFLREVRAAAQLAHPNIVTAHDAEQAGDLHFLVMEFVDGVSLARLVEKRGPQSVAHACHFARQAALGLQHAHERGLVHRDVKPQNLMVTRQGQVKILDFGLARLADEGGGRRRITRAGTVIGTPDYMAPEQARDPAATDARGDVYSLGCTLYFLLAGRPPFPEGSAEEKLVSHAEDAPYPLAEARPGLPPGLDEVVEKMMAKGPAQRYQTAGEVALALAPFAKAAPAAAVETPAPAAPRPADGEPDAQERQVDRKTPRPAARRPGRRMVAPIVLGVVVFLGVVGAVATWLALRDRGGSAGTATEPSGPPVAQVRPRKVLYVLPRWGLWYPDFGPVRDHLVKHGATVTVASSETGACVLEGRKDKEGAVPVDVVLNENFDPGAYDAVVFAGVNVTAYCDPKLPAGRVARRLIDDMQARKKPVAAICMGQMVLVMTGKLDDRPAAANRLVQDKAREHARDHPVRWEARDVIVDPETHIITAADAKAAVPFAEEILRAMDR